MVYIDDEGHSMEMLVGKVFRSILVWMLYTAIGIEFAQQVKLHKYTQLLLCMCYQVSPAEIPVFARMEYCAIVT